jgi:hypothetical protein
MHFYDHGSSYGSVSISIQSHGTYIKPAQFTIEVDTRELSSENVFILLGFYQAAPSSGADPLAGFTGFAFHTNGGSLSLIENGVTKNSVAFTGTFVPSDFHTLSYTVHTATGAVSDVTLSGSTSAYDFSSAAFTGAATQVAATGVEEGGDANACSYIDNFVVKT